MLLCQAALLVITSAAHSQAIAGLNEREATYDELGLDAYSRQQSNRLQQLLVEEGLEEIARNNSCGFWVAIRTPNASIVAQVGYSEITQPLVHTPAGSISTREKEEWENNNKRKATTAKATDVIPSGSLMKSMTAAAIMRLVDSVGLNLDDPITQHVNPYLRKMNNKNGSSLEQIFGPLIANTTLRSLLSMHGGFGEYDNQVVQREGFEYPDHDITPDEYLFGSYLLNQTIIPNKLKWRCNSTTSIHKGTVDCNPPSYNSVGFMLLGYVLAAHYNATSWDRFDYKRATIPPTLLLPTTTEHGNNNNQTTPSPYDGLVFFTKGKCSEYKNVAHYYNFQYNTTGVHCYAEPKGHPCQFVDQYYTSCLNGWGFGNVGATALAAASFFWDLVGRDPKIVSGQSALEMQQWGDVLAGHRWEKYGLGLMWMPLERYGELNASLPGTETFHYAVGHNGVDYGTYTHNGYHPSLDISTSFMINKDQPLWINNTRVTHPEVPYCHAYRAVFRLIGMGGIGNASFICDDRDWSKK